MNLELLLGGLGGILALGLLGYFAYRAARDGRRVAELERALDTANQANAAQQERNARLTRVNIGLKRDLDAELAKRLDKAVEEGDGETLADDLRDAFSRKL